MLGSITTSELPRNGLIRIMLTDSGALSDLR